ncbi:hypothetical protein ES692_02205 [Psychroserpens burtonensis]|uniref:Uncharacterized protein n=1 Tax=Psychroserpens burtonensis TaxID=49278 RepID=A0A5C7BDB2_9FLAO|nr:hypothetical protein [Psychroserpens burtonensis]TXE19587.1 hypothetical protein ES692_02205 [Psychroserpens burtonensis]
MKFKLVIILVIIPVLISSQNLERSNFYGHWRFKNEMKMVEIGLDTLSTSSTSFYAVEAKFEKKVSERLDIKISNTYFKLDSLESSYWRITDNLILIYKPVTNEDLEYYKDYTIGIIEQLEDNKYYYTKPYILQIETVNETQLIINDGQNKLIYIKQ